METPRQPANFELGDCSQLYRHTIPIFDCDQNPALLRGTGVFIAVDEHRFVVSAAHVFEPPFESIGLGFRDGSYFGLLAVQGRILLANDQAGGGNAQRTVYKDGLDFSIILPTPEVVERIESHYRSFDLRCSSYSPETTWAVVSGWPAKKNAFDRRKRQWKFHTCYHIQCPFEDVEKVQRAGWNTDIFFGLSADKEKDFDEAASAGESIFRNCRA
jgi:hypothetical protein